MDLKFDYVPIGTLTPYARNARTHSKKQIRQIADSIQRFGFTNPILIGDDNVVVAGHGRLAAAKLLGKSDVPVVKLSHLSESERRAYVIADNRLAEKAGWDNETLALELQALADIGFEVELTGFDLAEIDKIIGDIAEADPDGPGPEDQTPDIHMRAVSQPGDIWVLGRHRLICGDARQPVVHQRLMANELADMVFTDPPYNVEIDGHVCGGGKVKHREFAMAAGEMSEAEFTAFLTDGLSAAAGVCRSGAVAFVCMDWRHLPELMTAGRAAFSRWMNLIVWKKANGGMGTFYRSQHELILAFKIGDEPHTNTFGLGGTGRYRTNVWEYAGVNSFRSGRMDELSMHSTVKPVALVEDAIKDVTKRGGLVLDAFGGSGSTLIAAERCGRRARLIEYDPLYCDVIVRRWQAYTGKAAYRDGVSFEDAEDADQPYTQPAEVSHV